MSRAHTGHRTRTLCLIGCLHACTHVYTVALLPLYLQIQKDLNLSTVGQATLLVTVMGLSYVIPSYPLGVLADRFSRRKLLSCGLAINALGFIGLGLSNSYGTALACAIIAGVGGSFYHPAATALIAGLFPEGRGRALGLVGIGASAGFFAGPICSGWRAAATGSWRAPVLELGIVGLLFALAFLWLADEQPAAGACTPAGENLPNRTPTFKSGTLWFYFLAATLLLSFRDFAGQAMGTGASLFLQNAHGYDPKLAGIALSCVFIMSAISNPLFGHLSDKARLRWATVVLTCGAALAASVPYVQIHFVIPTFLGYGFFFMAGYPITEAALMESVPDEVRGRVFGLFMTIGGLVGNFSHWVIGEWTNSLGAAARQPSACRPMFAVLGLMILFSITAFPFLHKLRKAEHMPPQPPSDPQLP